MLKRKYLLLLLLVGFAVAAQEKKSKERLEKANFRVQIFQKSDDTEIKLTEPDPEFRDKLPISAASIKVSLMYFSSSNRLVNRHFFKSNSTCFIPTLVCEMGHEDSS